jgi:hypothetical protein
MHKKLIRIISLLFLLSLIFYHTINCQENIITINDIANEQIQLKGFTLETDKVIHMESIGAGGEKEINRIHNFQEDPNNLFAYSWIIDASTRELVWRMTINNTEKNWWNKWNRTFKGDIALKKGDYELYFASVEPTYFSFSDGFLSFGKIVDKVLGHDKWWQEHAKEWKITIRGIDQIFEKSAVIKFQTVMKNSAILSLTEIGDNQKMKKKFSLKKAGRLKIYAIGEGYKKEMYDYAWIIDTNTDNKVWEMREEETQYSGGAIKNRIINKEIDFQPGDYTVYYKSDENHSFKEWGANPPYDPYFWGITIYAMNHKTDKSINGEFEETKGKPIVQLIRVGNNEHQKKQFIIKQPTKIHIYALGEGDSNEMYDYAWIEDFTSKNIIWKMMYKDTQKAGGNSKNRMYNGIMVLNQGVYVAHYCTDDSHAYNAWNALPPADQQNWGLTIYER